MAGGMPILVHADSSTLSGGAEARDETAVQVATAVARAKGVDPIELDALHEVLDPDALDDLVTSTPGPVCVEFEYERHTVTVRGDGHVVVE